MSSPKNLSPTRQSNPNPLLPDDLILSCVARVSRLYYPTLSLVSKSFQSLLASPELYKARLLLDRTESCLYVCLQLNPFGIASWFTLCRKPDQTLTYDTRNKKKSFGYVLATVPISHHAHVQRSRFVAVGSYCDIENVEYSVVNGAFNWYDTEVRRWRKLKGLVGLPTFSISNCVRLFYYGGKMAVLWDEVLHTTCNMKMIWCAEITLERRSSCEIWGKVEWFDHVLTVPITYVFENVLVATI